MPERAISEADWRRKTPARFGGGVHLQLSAIRSAEFPPLGLWACPLLCRPSLRRARYLLDGAKHVVEKLGGSFPETAKELLQVPGM